MNALDATESLSFICFASDARLCKQGILAFAVCFADL